MANTVDVTVRGVALTVDRDRLSTLDFVELLADVDEGNTLLMPKLLKFTFGNEQYTAIKAALAGEDGTTPMSAIIGFWVEAFAALNETEAKN